MDKEKIFSKISSKDYNTELEYILENKNFSEVIKNLLLSMLYKIDSGYKDYKQVKRVVQEKKKYIEEILEIIDNKCKKIEIVKEDTEEAKELEEINSRFLVDKIEGTIKVIHPNEKLLLYTIYKLDDKQVYLDEKYNLIRNALSELLNVGENINRIEVLRDFNGWSWNTEVSEIQEISTNIIYQNLIYLLGIDFIKEWVNSGISKDYIPIVEKKLIQLYGKENKEEILNLIYKISIIICTDKNEKERNRLLEEKQEFEQELAKLNDKTQLLNDISANKKDALKEIKQIDTIMNDKKILEEEYIKRNEKRAEYNKIFSITHLIEILERQRRKIMNSIEENNKILDPIYYVSRKQEIEKQLEMLSNIDNKDKEKNKVKYVIELQKVFLKCFEKKVKKVIEKEDILNLIYMYRYYNYLYISKEKQIKDIKELKTYLDNIQKDLVQKAIEVKLMTRIADNLQANIEIFKNIVVLRKIINIEDINIEIIPEEETFKIQIFDGQIQEGIIQIININKKEILIKSKKKIKLM